MLAGLRTGKRLVTLVGPGGVGKTRLAHEFGRSLLGKGKTGVWSCDLTGVATVEGISEKVCEVLGLQAPRAAGPAMARGVGESLKDVGSLLLILDNVEHAVNVLNTCLDMWLKSAPKLWVIVTSRQGLKRPDEEIVRLGPLSTRAAVELFIQRSDELVATPVALKPDDPDLEDLVTALDKLPLAIELAAGRTALLSPRQILDRVKDRLGLLTGGEASRHGTLRATIDWSWQLLEPWERAAMAQLAVFRGGFTVESAEQIVNLQAWPDAPWILFVLESLLERSMLYDATKVDGEPRFSMLLSIQDYAREQLGEDPAFEQIVRRRHLSYFSQFGALARLDTLFAPGSEADWARLHAEQENLAAAVREAVELVDYRAGAQSWLAMALLGRAGHARDDLYPLFLSLEKMENIKEELLAWLALRIADRMAHYETTEQQVSRMERSLAIATRRGWDKVAARLVGRLASFARFSGAQSKAEGHYVKAIRMHRAAGDQYGEMYTLGQYSQLASDQGDMEHCIALAKESLEMASKLGYLPALATQAHSLGIAYLQNGEVDSARENLFQAIRIAATTGDQYLLGLAYVNMGCSYQITQEWERARTLFLRALPIFEQRGERRQAMLCLGNLGEVLGSGGQNEESIHYLRRAIASGRALGLVWEPGAYLAVLGSEEAKAGRIEQGREALAEGERLLRMRSRWYELGLTLCRRGELEILASDVVAARRCEAEVGQLIERHPTAPDSELRQRFRELGKNLRNAT